jgi:hypothetical protein
MADKNAAKRKKAIEEFDRKNPARPDALERLKSAISRKPKKRRPTKQGG